MNTKEFKFPIAGIFFVLSFIAKFFALSSQMSSTRGQHIMGMVVVAILVVAVFVKKNKFILIATAMMFVVYVRSIFSTGISIKIYALGILTALLIMLVLEIPKLEKYKQVATQIWFLPGVLLLASYLAQPLLYIQYGMNLLDEINLMIMILEYVERLGDLYTAIGYFILMKWMINPYKGESDPVNKYNSLGMHIFLYFITFGIWFYIWIYNTTKELNEMLPGEKQYEPLVQTLLSLFVPFYRVYWLYANGKRQEMYARSVGMRTSDTATLCLVLGILFPFVASCVLQSGINKIYRRTV